MTDRPQGKKRFEWVVVLIEAAMAIMFFISAQILLGFLGGSGFGLPHYSVGVWVLLGIFALVFFSTYNVMKPLLKRLILVIADHHPLWP